MTGLACGRLTLAIVVLAAPPVATLLPLLVLAVVFEAIFAIHTGVERVGRYLQVYFEAPDETARWENVAMAYGRAFAGGGGEGAAGTSLVGQRARAAQRRRAGRLAGSGRGGPRR